MPIPHNDEVEKRAMEILGRVTVEYFTATPDSIGPFGTSVLAWSIEGPPSVSVTIEATQVARTGSMQISPSATRTYHLFGHVSIYSMLLATVTVTMNQSSCIMARSPDTLKDLLETIITMGLRTSPKFEGFYFPDEWEPDRKKIHIDITANNVFFKVQFKKRIKYFPNPLVTLSADFKIFSGHVPLLVTGRKPEAGVSAFHSDVTVPWYAWFVPGAVPALTIALGLARDDARAKSQDMAQLIAETIGNIDKLFTTIPAGHEFHHIFLYKSADGVEHGDSVYCYNEPASQEN